MKAIITKIEEHPSKHGGQFWYVFFSSLDDGKSYRTCLSSIMRNFPAWAFVLQAGFDRSTVLHGLELKADGLINADCPPQRGVEIVSKQPESANPAAQAGLFGDKWTTGQHNLKTARREAKL